MWLFINVLSTFFEDHLYLMFEIINTTYLGGSYKRTTEVLKKILKKLASITVLLPSICFKKVCL